MKTALALLLLIVFATASQAQTPEHFWSRGFGGINRDEATGVAVDAAGNVVVVGYFSDWVSFGAGSWFSASDAVFVAKYDANGVYQWSRISGSFGSNGDATAWAVAVDGSGNIFVTGDFTNTMGFGGALVSAGGFDMFVAKFDANGVLQWSQRFGDTGTDVGYGIAADGSGNVVVTGGFTGTANFGGGNLVTDAGSTDIFVAKYNASGVHQWSQRFGGSGLDEGDGVAVDGSGNVVVTGSFQGTVNFGGGDLVSAGSGDIFVAKYDANGVHQWSQRFGGSGPRVAVDGSGSVVVTGRFQGTVNFGGGNLMSNAGSTDIFVAKYDASGVPQWSQRFGGSGFDYGYGVAVDGPGNVVVTGGFELGVYFGGSASWVSAGYSDMFVAKFNASGVHQYSRGFGGTSGDVGVAIAVDGSGNAVVAGDFQGTASFGGGNLVSAGSIDFFVAKYGNPTIISQISDSPNDQGGHVKIHFMGSSHDAPGVDPMVLQYDAYRWTDLGWVSAAEVPATLSGEYVMDAPTDEDSTRTSGQHYSKFFIRAQTTLPGVFFDSAVDSGYSVDNLAPGIPTNLVFTPGHLSWDASTAADFDHFSVYGSASPSFASASLIGTTMTPAMLVSELPYSFYFVTASDHSGNEGKAANVGTLTGVGAAPTSYALSLSAYPNPFNPETTIHYTLPARGRVTITVFDARGAHVATLVDAVMPQGAYTQAWNGRNDRGNAVSSGVFFVRLISAAGQRSYEMTLLK